MIPDISKLEVKREKVLTKKYSKSENIQTIKLHVRALKTMLY